MKIGYARVSREDQNLELQTLELRRQECEYVYADHGESGLKSDRPGLQRMLSQLTMGDIVVVTKLDRLSRSLNDMLAIIAEIENCGAEIRSLAEPMVDTTTPAGRLVFQIFAVVGEFERNRIRERTMEGLARAKLRGKALGRPRKLVPSRARQLLELRQQGRSYHELASIFGISASTAREYCLEESVRRYKLMEVANVMNPDTEKLSRAT